MAIGFIKDAFSGIPHVMASTDGNEIKLKSITEFGKSIISDFNFDKNDIAHTVPIGFMFTGFISEKQEISPKKIVTIDAAKNLVHAGSTKNILVRSKVNAIDLEINKFKNSLNKLNAVAFKASAFKTSQRKSEFIRRAKSGKVIFNERLSQIEINPKFVFSHIEKELLTNEFSQGFMRKTADRIAPKKGTNRRVMRRAKILTEITSESAPKKKKPISERIDKARKQVKYGR